MGALSSVSTNADIMGKLFAEQKLNYYGIYEFYFFKNGSWISVIVDDYLPIGLKDELAFSRCKDSNEFWFPLLQKAYAKLYGTYEALESCSLADVMVDFTGGILQTIELDSKEAMNQIAIGKLQERLVKFNKQGYFLGCETTNPKGEEIAFGIVDTREIHHKVLLRGRNISSGKGDPIFWIEFIELIQRFNRLHVIRMMEATHFPATVRGKWLGPSAGGVTTYPSWKNNPQFGFVNEVSQDVFISLVQEDTRVAKEGTLSSKPEGDPISIGFVLLKSENITERLESFSKQSLVAQTDYAPVNEGILEYHSFLV